MYTYICVSIQMLWNIYICINDYYSKNVIKKYKQTPRYSSNPMLCTINEMRQRLRNMLTFIES